MSAVALTQTQTRILLSRLVIAPTTTQQTFMLTARLHKAVGEPAIGGHWLWAIKPQILPGDDLGIRVWSPGKAMSPFTAWHSNS